MTVFLDACCLINLFGTGRAEEIFDALPYRFAVARYVVEEEVLEIGSDGEDETSPSDEGRVVLPPRLTDLVQKSVLEQFDVVTEREKLELVRFAAELDDGEAHTCALAIVRGARVATDDRKAFRVLRAAWKSRGAQDDPILRTSELLFQWAQAEQLGDRSLARILHTIARRASFLPPKDDPYFDRWKELLQKEP